MEYIYAAMLLHAAKKEVTESSVKKVLQAASVEVDDGRIKSLIASLADVNIDEAIKEAATTPVAVVAQSGEAAHKKEEKKEEKADPEAAMAGLGSLFG